MITEEPKDRSIDVLLTILFITLALACIVIGEL